ncbi:MAG TPA: hypothetical protein VD905_11755 [Flavobacteriales bacterium]|nr:hypothetical protein [Flavobacteriales bacterium]
MQTAVMKKAHWIIVFPFLLFSCKMNRSAPAAKKSEAATAERTMQMTVTGIAEHAKMGAIVVADDGKVYYIEGKPNWDKEGYYKKKIRVTGKMYTRTTRPEDLVNDKGEYSQGAEGESKFIRASEIELMK